MKNRKVFVIFCILLLAFSVNLMAEPARVIAVHYGNPEYEEVLIKEDYPGFEFYHTDGSEFMYQIKNEFFIGTLPSHLEGLYGEVPEKMGFSASFAMEKGASSPFFYGAMYVVASNGIVAAQTGPECMFQDDEAYYADYDVLKRELKKAKKNKLPKALPETKQVYFKSTPVGEREPYKKTNVDKKGTGIVGWSVPDITIYDEEGMEHKLPALVEGENCLVVFYTMNGVKKMIGDRKTGEIEEEYFEDKPVNSARKKMQAAGDAQNAQTKEDVKNLFKNMLQAVAEDINEFYSQGIGPLDAAKMLNKNVK